MKNSFLIAYVFIDLCACMLNLSTLIFVYKNVNLKTHVFSLLFLDSLSSTICSIGSMILDTIFLTKAFEPNFILCSLSYLMSYLSISFGAILTLLITVTRYVLATKSAKNIQLNNNKVTQIVLGIFTAAAGFNIIFFIVNLKFGTINSSFLSVCAQWKQGPKNVSILMVLFLFHPNICNFFSLLTDIKMLMFLQKVIIPTNNALSLGTGKVLQNKF